MPSSSNRRRRIASAALFAGCLAASQLAFQAPAHASSSGTGDDVAIGSPDGDAITGGPGRDVLLGQGGNDNLEARDGAGGDRVDGGPGADSCRTDPGDIRVSCP
jgi:hypothetical protein